MKGKHHTEKAKRKVSKSLIGNERALGYRFSDEAKRKMSESRKGRVPWNKGKHHTEEARKKMSESSSHWNKGKRLSEGTKKKMSEAHEGKKLSEEHKKRLSEVRKGMKRSEETKKKMSLSSKGRRHTEEAKRKIGLSSKGRVHSEETKQKMSESIRKAISEGRLKPHMKCEKFWSTKNDMWVNYRSSYELCVFEILEKMMMVVKYEVEPLRIKYRCGFDDVRTYFPDLLITYKDGSKELVEVKANWCVNHYKNQCKAKTAKKYCDKNGLTFNVWTEDEIFNHKLRRPG